MKSIEERLKEYGKIDLCGPDESKIKDTIVISKEKFYEGAEQREPYYFAFLYEQAAFIRKRWWVMQFLILFLTGWSARGSESGYYLQRLLGVSASLFVIMIIPEIWKSHSSHSVEIENAAYFSLRQVYAARMLLFAAVDGIFLTVFAGVLSLTKTVDIVELVIHFFLPMIVTCCICFRTLCSRYIASEYTACILSMLWSAVWILIILNDNIYNAVSRPVWLAVIGIAVLYLTYVVRRVMRKAEEDMEGYSVW